MKKSTRIFTGLAAILAFSLLSPKWLFAPAAWVAPALLLWTLRDLRFLRAGLLTATILLISGLISNYRVMPFPVPIFLIITLQVSIMGAIPYLLNRFLAPRLSGWVSTLVFPSIMIVYEFLTSQMGSGTWGNIAYTQTESLALMQLASVTGIWGISFLVYWFNSLIVWSANQPRQWSSVKVPVLAYTTVMTGVLLFGTLRMNPTTTTPANTVRVAGITGLYLEPLGQVYKDAFGKDLVFDPSTLTQTSPELVEINKGLVEFVADPLNDRFAGSRKAFEDYHDKMFSLAAREALAGSRIISFSEALLFTVKPEEDKLITKGRNFAREHRVYLVLTMGSFIPGKIEFGSKYIENKALVISPDGNVLTTFFKNKPVPLVEGSVPGDGSIPIIKTDYGKIAPSICYDADFPGLMRKAGQQEVDLMVLPSGDWREISPYHSHMARIRAIENGISLLRPVSGATSIACDPYGRVTNSRSFTDPGEKVLVSYLSTEGVFSLYPILGDWLVFLGFVWIAGLSSHSVWRWVATRRRSATPSGSEHMSLKECA